MGLNYTLRFALFWGSAAVVIVGYPETAYLLLLLFVVVPQK